MDRREFLQQLMMWTAGIVAAPPIFNLTSILAAEEKPSSQLVVGYDHDYPALVRKVLEPFGGMSAFVKKGARVVIKPNIGWDRSPEQAANTHPIVVQTLARLAAEAGASAVMIFDRTCNDERRCYSNSGIKAAVDALGDKRITCDYIDERKFVSVKIERGKALNEWPLYKDALEADCYINVPIAKHHGLSQLSLGFKNVMGIMGGNRGQIHHNIGQNLADLNTVVKPRLTVIDATRILLRNGPTGGDTSDVAILDKLIASTDPVAADAFATTLFKLEPREIEATRAAYELGLGEMDLTKIKVVNV